MWAREEDLHDKEQKRKGERGKKLVRCLAILHPQQLGGSFLLEGRGGNSPRKMDRTREEVVSDF